MKALINKELKLGIHPSCYFVFLFPFMVFIPNYPLVICFIFPLSLFPNVILSLMSENNDLEFSLLMPIRKKDYVASKLFSFLFLELTTILISVPLVLFRYFYMPASLENNPGLNNPLSLYATLFIGYGLFNFLIFIIYFKTAPKRIMAYLVAMFVTIFWLCFAGIIFAFIPGIGDALNKDSCLIYQLIYFFIGSILFIIMTIITSFISVKELESRNL